MNKTVIGDNRVFVLFIILLILGVSLVWMFFSPTQYAPTSANEIQLHDREGIYYVNNQMDVLADGDDQWTLADVQSPPAAGQFQPASGKSAFGLTAGTYWIRTTVRNQSSLEQWVIRLNNSVIEKFDMYLINEKSMGTEQSSIIEKADEHFSSYYIHLPAENLVTIYIRTVLNGSMIIPIELMDNQTFLGKLKSEYIFFGIYYGFVLLMAAYMLSMYMFNRVTAYLYYSLYIVCFSISQMVWNGLLQELLGADSRLLVFLLNCFGNYEGIDYFFFISCLWFGLLFLSKILQLEIYAPRMLIIYRILNIMSPLVLIASLFHFPGYAILAILYESMFAILLIVSTYWSVYRGSLVARYVVLATIPFLGLATPTILNTYSLMQESFLTHYGFQLGSIAEYIMFSIALSYQLGQSRTDKENALQQIIINQNIQQTRNELLQNISHDIRSPLTIVQGGIRAMMLGIEIEPGQKDKFLNTIYDRILYINTFIDDLFELSHLEQSRENAALETIHFADWIKHEFDSFASTIQLAGLQYESSISVDPQAVITINPHEIRRVLSNLVHNACKFSSIGGTVHLHASSSNGEVVVYIEDRGVGIASEHLPSIFNRAYKVDQTTSSNGSGLGLAIAKEIIERHNGLIWVESEPGKGSRFYFKLSEKYK
ncbi:sensor histidine kinase [Cohnella silvisoli]|uniref:histidine kinase n=1 Tax=Cohnella silvisoli TaxID=2873699 RepID=A0ABV1KZN7_9BACL|nr:sensor histidine kinase [Cohnella silvisoli]MCD9025009.1 sensor histidine kinase [Cohnella silvisoli]